jgi:predicted enzyme related to lactoylglutathione lyase
MQGQFVWYELLARNFPAAQSFYTSLLGWQVVPAEIPGMDYHIVVNENLPIGGMFPMTGDCPGPNGGGWIGYVAVEDVDDMAGRIEALGGRILMAPEDIPDIGRFAVVADPEGAPFVIFRALDPSIHKPLPAMKPGFTAWHELVVDDWERAFRFYETLFGWQKDEAMDMGPMGVYQLFSTDGKQAVGGMMKRQNGDAMGWRFYFGVEDIDAAMARIKAGGGSISFGPEQVPGDAWIVQGRDPQGSQFALVGQRQGAAS